MQINRLRWLAMSVVIAACGAANLASGQETAVPTKVGIINIQQAIISTKDGQKAREDLDKQFSPKYQQMEARQKELQALRDQYTKGVNTMAAEARDKLSREIDEKTRDYNRAAEDLQEEMQREQAKLVNVIGQQMLQIIDEHAKQNGFAVILDVSSEQSPVLWAANGIDITRDIVAKYDAKYSSGTGAAAPKPEAAKPAAPAK